MRLVDRVKDLRAVRAIQWYLARRGSLLCGGIAYSALFSLFAALAIGFTVFSATLGSRPELQAAVFDQIETWLPGLIGSPTSPLQPDQLIVARALSWTTILLIGVLLWTAISFMGSLRHSVRFMFDAPVVGVNPVLSKVWQLVGFALLGVMLLASAIASIASQTVTRLVEGWFGESPLLGTLLSLGTFGVGVLLDTLLVYLVIRVVARVRPRRSRDMLLGCLAAGLVSGVLRWLGTAAVTSSLNRNALLASVVAVGTVLLLANFVARVLLVVCAWMYDPPRLDEVARAEEEVVAMRRNAEIERLVHSGRGSGRPYSPVVRGVRRGLYAY